MLRRMILILLVIFTAVSFAACTADNPKDDDNNDKKTPDNTNTTQEVEETPEPTYGDPVPTFNEDWPSEMLPDDFPDLGKVTKVYDSRMLGNRVTINWNIVTEEEVHDIVDKLNAYLDYDHVWQGNFYSDGIKYKPGTEESSIEVVIRYMPSQSGAIEPELEAQFYLEISGVGLPKE